VTVDVVVVTYRSVDLLERCLASIPDGCPVTVVDNASGDGSAELAERLGALVVRNPANTGFGAAAGQGAARGDGDLILFLNPDAELAPGSLGQLVEAFQAEEGLAVAGPTLVSVSGAPQRSWWPFPSPGRTWMEALGLHRLLREPEGTNPAVPFVVGACMVVRRDRFEELGGFDSTFWLYGEEADLCRRARAAGWEVRCVTGATARHVGGASGGSDGGVAFEHFQRGSELFILKHHGRRGLFVHRVGLLVGSVVRLPALALQRGGDQGGRFARRLAMVRRLLRILVTHPTRAAA
jgi:N-acetylglucosaminyl-diphospho-decaprenol L-rhamnosyltransferase